jgi:hypothetical protein
LVKFLARGRAVRRRGLLHLRRLAAYTEDTCLPYALAASARPQMLHPPASDTEFSTRPVHQKIEMIHIRQDNTAAAGKARAALAAIRERRRAAVERILLRKNVVTS